MQAEPGGDNVRMNATLTIDDIRAAAARLHGEISETPCLPSRTLGEMAGCEVFLKFENHQFTASFKERGALNKMAQLTAAERARGVLKPGDTYAITCGEPMGRPGGTNMLKVCRVG